MGPVGMKAAWVCIWVGVIVWEVDWEVGKGYVMPFPMLAAGKFASVLSNSMFAAVEYANVSCPIIGENSDGIPLDPGVVTMLSPDGTLLDPGVMGWVFPDELRDMLGAGV